MKATSIIFLIAAILVLAFIILQAFVSRSTNKTETVEYKVLQSYDEFEIRSYPNVNYSSVSMVKQSYKDVSGSGFRVLAGYIFGGNEENKSIAMTTPVAMEMGDTMRMKFIIPKEYEISDYQNPMTRISNLNQNLKKSSLQLHSEDGLMMKNWLKSSKNLQPSWQRKE